MFFLRLSHSSILFLCAVWQDVITLLHNLPHNKRVSQSDVCAHRGRFLKGHYIVTPLNLFA